MKLTATILGILIGVTAVAGGRGSGDATQPMTVYSVVDGQLIESSTVDRSDDDWRQRLTPEQFRIARKHGTERAFSDPSWNSKAEGVYRCVACDNDLFVSSTKYDSGTGWPSFYEPVHANNIGVSKDRTLWMVRTEVHCARCGSHLGHVFPDGPQPTGLRYCINGTVMKLEPFDVDRDGTIRGEPGGSAVAH